MPWYKLIFYWVITLLVPIALVLMAVRILVSPIYIQIEYRLPGFPPDPYGFTTDERLHWAGLSRQYLVNSTGIEFLSELRFEDGTPIYNQRELSHMVDVKNVLRIAMWVFYGSLVTLVGAGIWVRRVGGWNEYARALSRGGWLTVGLIVVVILFIAINFNTLFVAFHRVFFEGDTWLFKYSDTLIRLFPVRFWRDAFIMVGGIAFLAGALIGRFLGSKRA
jgi:integral membrane protein (TIGR01906 family)